MKWIDLRFLLALLLPMLMAFGLWTAPQRALLYTALVIFTVNLCEWLLPARSPVAHEKENAYFTWVLRLYAPLQLLVMGLGAYATTHSNWLLVMSLAVAVGYITGAQGITFAHELGHKKSKFDRLCAWVLMSSVCYSHFMVEHYRGHHPRAATWGDHATARYGENLYQFLPRSVFSGFKSAWQLESQRLVQMKSSWVHSPLLRFTGVSLLMLCAPFLVVNMPLAAENTAQLAIKMIVFLLLQSAVAVLLLETVNYIEHYGLSRKVEGGKREPFGLMHAWNADHPLTNSILANLQRHSDHHTHAWKPYETLTPAYSAPQLPTGYAGCIWLAAVPPLWFALMHPRLEKLKLKSSDEISGNLT